MKNKKRNGFVLYIVITILLGLSLLAFALNDFKRGAVTQLSKNIDQNRLIQICKSANTETLALIRSRVNDKGANEVNPTFEAFRAVFKNGMGSQNVPCSNSETKKMAAESGYDIEVFTEASVTSYKTAPQNAIDAYNAYLDIKSIAYRVGFKENSIQVSERHEVRLVDLRHYLDKYVLFVKKYPFDLNNTQRKIIIEGNEQADVRVSKVYLGDIDYPNVYEGNDAKDNKRIWLDLDFDYIKNMPAFADIFGGTTQKSFTTSGGPKLFYTQRKKFDQLPNIRSILPNEYFYHVSAVKKVYETFVNLCADGLLNVQSSGWTGDNTAHQTEHKIGIDLKNKCKEAMTHGNSNSATFRVCRDCYNNYKRGFYDGLEVDDYSACEYFQSILETCITNWNYEYGYLDATNIWKVNSFERNTNHNSIEAPELQEAVSQSDIDAFKGLTKKDSTTHNKYVLFDNYFLEKGGKKYNPERCNLGQMLLLYGADGKTPVLVEGPVYIRFFKLAYFDRFSSPLTMLNGQSLNEISFDIKPDHVPILFRRKDREPITFQSKELSNDFSSNSNYFKDKDLMSKPIDSIPVNALILKSNVKYYDGNGAQQVLKHQDVFKEANPFLKPASKNNSAQAIQFRREISKLYDITYSYTNSAKFVADRIKTYNGKNTLFVDGVMYIDNGSLDLTQFNVESFYGKGLVYLNHGNLILGNLGKAEESRYKDSIRFYLRDGSIRLASGSGGRVEIEASLAALSYNNSLKGTIDLGNNKDVYILGNLLVDKIDLIGANGLSKPGTLTIQHNPLIMEPGVSIQQGDLDPFQASISKVKTSFAIKAGGIDID